MKCQIFATSVLLTGLAFAQMNVKDNDNHILMQVNDEGTMGSITLPDTNAALSTQTNKLYNLNGSLIWNGTALGAAGSSDFSNGGEAGGAERTLGNTDNFGLGLMTNDTTRFYISNLGNMGIGTSIPAAKLSIDLGETDGNAAFSITEGDNERFGLYGYFVAAGEANKVVLKSDANPNIMSWQNGGNVGIGTATPDVPFEVVSSNAPVIRGVRTSSVTNNHLTTISGLAKTTGDMEDWFGSLISFQIQDDVAGPYNIAYISGRRDGEDNSGMITFETFNSGSKGTQMVIDKTGNVGIGTTSPAGKLDVNGSIYQRGGVLHADYVFEDDYKLESIDDHALYMWKHKHLKAIPKSEVDQYGQEIVEVGSHRKGIVEELEKAHIYIEQLHGEIDELKLQMAEMKKIMSSN